MSEIQGSTVIPGMRYRDALKMIDWLCRAFGFTKQAVYTAEDGVTVMHAQLTLGKGMVMLGSVSSGTAYGELLRQPDEIGGFETQTSSLIVANPDAVYAMAKQAGAQMVIDIADMSYGGRSFTCRDPEGHIWSIGSYDPWAEHA